MIVPGETTKVTLKYDGHLTIATGRSRKEISWKTEKYYGLNL